MNRLIPSSAGFFLAQLAALGLFSKIILIIAILSLLSLNDYFTTQSQLASLLPVGFLLIVLLGIVAIADTVSGRIIQSVINRLAAIHSLFGFSIIANSADSGTPAQQRYYLKTIFLPFVTSVLPAPLLAIVMLTASPLLFLVTVAQSLTNGFLIFRYNRILASNKGIRSRIPRQQALGPDREVEERAHLLRSSPAEIDSQIFPFGVADNSSASNEQMNKRDALRSSNMIFRASIFVGAALLAIYKLSPLTSLVAFLLLNNVVRNSLIVICEYTWPPRRHLSFQQACEQIRLSLAPESQLIDELQAQAYKETELQTRFDERMQASLQEKPFVRFKDFSISGPDLQRPTIIDDLTARIELFPITLIQVSGATFCRDLAGLILDRGLEREPIKVRGLAFCAQLKIDASFWRHLPIANPQRTRIVSPSLVAHFPEEQRPHVIRLIDRYELTRFYLEGDPAPLTVQGLSARQIKRMSALIAMIDLLLQHHSLWLVPFALDSFEESEALSLLSFYRQEMPANQLTVFLVWRQLPPVDDYRYYELKRTSLKRVT